MLGSKLSLYIPTQVLHYNLESIATSNAVNVDIKSHFNSLNAPITHTSKKRTPKIHLNIAAAAELQKGE